MDTEVESGNLRGRPNYSPEFKHRLAVAACKPGVSVSKLAQDHGINSNMLSKWRRDLRAGLLTEPATNETRLLPVVLKLSSPAAKPATGAVRASPIEITIADATVRVCAGTDAAIHNPVRLGGGSRGTEQPAHVAAIKIYFPASNASTGGENSWSLKWCSRTKPTANFSVRQ